MSAPLVLHLMRHGAPATPGLLIGHVDMASSPAGIAACLGQANGIAFEAVVTSDLSRAATAAEGIAASRRLAARRDERWRELSFGAWEGLAPSAVDPVALGAFWADPESCPPPDGERWSALRARVAEALEDLSVPTLVVAHAGSIRAALSLLCGFDQRQCWAIDLPYAAVVSLRWWRGADPSAQITGLVPCAG